MKTENAPQNVQWLEVVRLRTSPSGSISAITAAKELLKDIEEHTHGVQTGLMQDAQGLGDIEAIIVWDKGRSINKSHEGYLIAEKFREFGMTNHDIWQVIHGFDDCIHTTSQSHPSPQH